ncbi:MAG: Gfo/Idh/MocA family protein, partial [Limisphaerales bacterium]
MKTNTTTNRRSFLKTGTTAAALLPLALQSQKQPTLRIGLIGCGGRGTGAAAQALKADPDVALVAMGDLFADRLEISHNTLSQASDVADRVKVAHDHRFVGWDAFEQVIASEVDCVILTTPPHFRPTHLRAAIEAGKHVFAEKPVAVDAPGVRSVLASCRLAKEKKLSVVS